MMEEAEKPFNLERLLKYTKTIYPYNFEIEKSLLPYEILELVEKKLQNIDLDNKNLITNLMINGLSDFFNLLALKLCYYFSLY